MVKVVATGTRGSEALGMGPVQTELPCFTSDFKEYKAKKNKTKNTKKSARVLSNSFTALINMHMIIWIYRAN